MIGIRPAMLTSHIRVSWRGTPFRWASGYRPTFRKGFVSFVFVVKRLTMKIHGPGSNWLRAGRSGDQIFLGARFSAPVQTGPEAHPASCTMGTGSFPGVKSGRCVTLTLHPLLVPWSLKSRAIFLLPLWAVRPVQSLIACTRVNFTLP
jgi:hypothetical protein